MNKFSKTAGFALSVLFGGLLISGCNPEQQKTDNISLKPLTLARSLSISVADDPNVLVGDFSGLEVDNDGIMYAADTRLQKIHLYSPDGKYLDSLGREGKGPGEFTRIDPAIRVMSDTLYVKERNAHRISLFNLKSRELAGTFNIPNTKLDGVSMGGPRDFFPLSDGTLLISFINTSYSAPEEGDPPHLTTISQISTSGQFITKKLLQVPTPFPGNQGLVHISERSVAVFANVTFYPDLMMATDPEEYLYIGKSDSLRMRKFNANGELTGIVQGTYEPAPLTDHYMDSLYDSKGNTFNKAVNDAGRPAYWPAFEDFLFDDTGRSWVELITPGKSQKTWWVFNQEGKPEWEVKLPAEVSLFVVKKGRAYGILQSDEELPSIVRYDVKEFGDEADS